MRPAGPSAEPPPAAGSDDSQLEPAPEEKAEAPRPPPPRESPQPALTWLEIELVDDEGEPIADELYDVKLSDGSVRCGRLDKQGWARLSDVPEGPCTVRFPELTTGIRE